MQGIHLGKHLLRRAGTTLAVDQRGGATLLPAGSFCSAKALRPIAGAPAEHQFGQPGIVKPGFIDGQLLRVERSQLRQATAVCGVHKTVVEVLVYILRAMAFQAAVHLLPQHTHVRQGSRFHGVVNARLHVDAPARRHLWRQRFEVAHHHG